MVRFSSGIIVHRFFIVLWIICTITSCGKNPNAIDPIEQHRYDSLLAVEGDLALDNIRFGISPTQYEIEIKKFIDLHRDNDDNVSIMGSNYGVLFTCNKPKRFYGHGIYSDSKFINICSVEDFRIYENSNDVHNQTSTIFCNGKLYSFNIETSGVRFSDEVNLKMTNCIIGLKKLFEKRYGKPTKSVFINTIDWTKVLPGGLYPLIKWEMGVKSVIVYVRALDYYNFRAVYAGATLKNNGIFQNEKEYSTKNNVSSSSIVNDSPELVGSGSRKTLASMEYIVESESFAAISKEAFNQLNKVCNNKDQSTLLNMISNGLVYILPANLKVRLINGGLSTSKIRILEGDNIGLELFISSEFIVN